MNEVHTEALDAMHNKSSSDKEGSAKNDGDVGEITSYGSRRRLFIFILLLSYLDICVLYRMILPKQLCTIALIGPSKLHSFRLSISLRQRVGADIYNMLCGE